jgi:phage terminase large subunit-like protein
VTDAFALTAKQREANKLLGGPAMHILLYGGSRSGKTLLIIRAIVWRALYAPGSRHAVLRFRLAHVKASIVNDTFPKVMKLCFPREAWDLDKQEWRAILRNTGSEIWFGGLDDKERTEKILGMEFASVFLNECSQIPYNSRNLAVTRLAQRVQIKWENAPPHDMRQKMYYDENPPDKAHWTYRLFRLGIDPETKERLKDGGNYACLQVNPRDNLANLPDKYISTLEGLSARNRRRFLEGEFRDARPDALFSDEVFDKWRQIDLGDLPDMQRIVVAIDPSGSGDIDNSENDAIGIVVAGLGTDGIGYCLEDLTVLAGPKTWANIAITAYDRWNADLIVAETNYGGAMVQQVIRTARTEDGKARSNIPFKAVNASRGKVVRAEPISALAEQGKVRMAGNFVELEEELCGFTTAGYTGSQSPNRADAFVWAFAELFPAIVQPRVETVRKPHPQMATAQRYSWMG